MLSFFSQLTFIIVSAQPTQTPLDLAQACRPAVAAEGGGAVGIDAVTCARCTHSPLAPCGNALREPTTISHFPFDHVEGKGCS
mmetsp:Transcript_51499/g.85879  ORF Transcript_51499/g.85879 Transcript_51499/m.85879 type:complete len:83 (-) Transcript_51499:208-456(-)